MSDAAFGPRSRSARGPGAVLLLLGVAACAPGAPAEPALKELDAVATRYRIEVVSTGPRFPVALKTGTIDGKAADEGALRAYAPLFVAEFALYPVELVRKARLKRVVLCGELSFAGQRRNAIPDWANDTLYLDVSRGADNKTYLRKVIHHEFFHIIDYRDDGRVYQDERWAALNPTGFTYGSGGRTVQYLRTTSVLTTEYPGFLNHYSTTGVEEDKAEVFANLIVDPTYIDDRAAQDRVIRAKVARMKELLAEFCPEMDDRFWAQVGRRSGPAPGVRPTAPAGPLAAVPCDPAPSLRECPVWPARRLLGGHRFRGGVCGPVRRH